MCTKKRGWLRCHLFVSFLQSCRVHYTVYLQSIAVNGQILPVDPGVFVSSGDRGTIVDSGTTLVYLASEAYEPFISAVSVLFSICTKILKLISTSIFLC